MKTFTFLGLWVDVLLTWKSHIRKNRRLMRKMIKSLLYYEMLDGHCLGRDRLAIKEYFYCFN